jgi:glucose-6-phosphate 1-epimerase
MIGTLTRRVIVLEQQHLGMQPKDGRAGMNVLQALQRESSTP